MKFKRFIVPFLFFMASGFSVFAQINPLPLNIQQAFNKETRSKDGKPGKNYWQNHADYKMEATLDTENDRLDGRAVIKYDNDSPDTLKTIIIRLYQDFFRKGNARQWPVPEDDLTEGVQIKKLVIGGLEYDSDKDFPNWYITNFYVRLKNPIMPHSTETIEVDWSFEIPTVRGLRMRKYDDGHYFIAYWYPQIAVYDDIDGWDQLEYTGTVEFYNDFNNFDVSLTLPGDYLIWATGELANENSIFQPEINERINKAKKSDEVVRIVNISELNDKKILQKGKSLTWNFKADHVPDFSFAASNKSIWDGTSLVVDSITGRRVLTDVVYPDGSKNWDRGAEISRASVEYLSFELPGIPFPYPHMTSFCSGPSGGGMETPMMANDGIPENLANFVELVFHEISHTYFPFYMGNNERKYAWMDEGWAAYLPTDLSARFAPERDYFKHECKSYTHLAGDETELPLMVPTFQHNSYSSARVAAYTRPAMAYHFLRDALGDDMFKKALREYIHRWNGKHPLPYDFFNTFENITGEDLNWFWQTWFYGYGYADLGIRQVNDGHSVVIEKAGILPIPVDITYTLENGKEGKKYISTAVWKDNKQTVTIDLPANLNIIKIRLGNDHIPDVNDKNNWWEKSDLY
ncbi:MAG: M1 family metallopeptidase [Bacteroidales bacterium]|nr:M1 family metallopeptidase [Bacteroidales bacterium]